MVIADIAEHPAIAVELGITHHGQPVPATDRLHVNAPEPLRAVAVYDALGATVAVPREGGNTLLVATLHPGMYLLRATTVGGAVYTLRFAKE